jgi:hypothetical protein
MLAPLKVREDLAPGDYRDPGWYKHPKGTVAYEVDVAAEDVQQQQPSAGGSPGTELQMPGMKNADAARRWRPQQHH